MANTGIAEAFERGRPRAAAGRRREAGLFVDGEAAGLDTSRREIIKLAMAWFFCGWDGQVFAAAKPVHGLRQPSHPIQPEITAIAGIADVMAAGHVIDPSEVSAFGVSAVLIIAHNAAFDRRFLER